MKNNINGMEVTYQSSDTIDIWKYIDSVFKIGSRSSVTVTLYNIGGYIIRSFAPLPASNIRDW